MKERLDTAWRHRIDAGRTNQAARQAPIRGLGRNHGQVRCRRSIFQNSDGRPVSDTFEDVDELEETLSPDQITSLELGLESYRRAGGELSSSRYRAMVDMVSDLGDQYRRTRWSMEGESGERLRQLVEMLDHAAGAV